jgi:maleylpyruvate isomerase
MAVARWLRNLLIWARSGQVTPTYPSSQARAEAIEAGSGRPAAELLADLAESAAGFAQEAAAVPASAWDAMVHGVTGREHPAWFTLLRRLSEVEIHHVDLGLGYGPPDWPAPFVADGLERVIGQFAARDDVPACVLEITETGQRAWLGPRDTGREARAVTVTGPGCWVLAWLTGRDPGSALSVSPSGGREPADGRPGLPPKLPKWS